MRARRAVAVAGLAAAISSCSASTPQTEGIDTEIVAPRNGVEKERVAITGRVPPPARREISQRDPFERP